MNSPTLIPYDFHISEDNSLTLSSKATTIINQLEHTIKSLLPFYGLSSETLSEQQYNYYSNTVKLHESITKTFTMHTILQLTLNEQQLITGRIRQILQIFKHLHNMPIFIKLENN